MKRFALLILPIILLTFAGCGEAEKKGPEKKGPETNEEPVPNENPEATKEVLMSRLHAFYSMRLGCDTVDWRESVCNLTVPTAVGEDSLFYVDDEKLNKRVTELQMQGFFSKGFLYKERQFWINECATQLKNEPMHAVTGELWPCELDYDIWSSTQDGLGAFEEGILNNNLVQADQIQLQGQKATMTYGVPAIMLRLEWEMEDGLWMISGYPERL